MRRRPNPISKREFYDELGVVMHEFDQSVGARYMATPEGALAFAEHMSGSLDVLESLLGTARGKWVDEAFENLGLVQQVVGRIAREAQRELAGTRGATSPGMPPHPIIDVMGGPYPRGNPPRKRRRRESARSNPGSSTSLRDAKAALVRAKAAMDAPGERDYGWLNGPVRRHLATAAVNAAQAIKGPESWERFDGDGPTKKTVAEGRRVILEVASLESEAVAAVVGPARSPREAAARLTVLPPYYALLTAAQRKSLGDAAWRASRSNPRMRGARGGKRNNGFFRKGHHATKKPRSQVPEYSVPLSEARGQPGYAEALAAYKRFHSANPSEEVRAFVLGSGPIERTRVVAQLGEAPEVHYVIPEDQKSPGKENTHWVHKTHEEKMPAVLYDPLTKTTILAGGAMKTREWLYD